MSIPSERHARASDLHVRRWRRLSAGIRPPALELGRGRGRAPGAGGRRRRFTVHLPAAYTHCSTPGPRVRADERELRAIVAEGLQEICFKDGGNRADQLEVDFTHIDCFDPSCRFPPRRTRTRAPCPGGTPPRSSASTAEPTGMRGAMATAGSCPRTGCSRPRGAVDRGQDPGCRHTLPVTVPVDSIQPAPAPAPPPPGARLVNPGRMPAGCRRRLFPLPASPTPGGPGAIRPRRGPARTRARARRPKVPRAHPHRPPVHRPPASGARHARGVRGVLPAPRARASNGEQVGVVGQLLPGWRNHRLPCSSRAARDPAPVSRCAIFLRQIARRGVPARMPSYPGCGAGPNTCLAQR